MKVYRISKCLFIKDLSGWGSSNFAGRWNSKGTYVLYTAATPSLALLESVAHLSNIPPDDFCMITLEIPEKSIHRISQNELPSEWAYYPPPEALKSIGDKFIQENKFLVLQLPSAIMPEDSNLLVNPAHPMFKDISISAERSLFFDKRLIKQV